jgi:hypothetical protein
MMAMQIEESKEAVNLNEKCWYFNTFFSAICVILAFIIIPRGRHYSEINILPFIIAVSFGIVLGVTPTTKGCLANRIIAAISTGLGVFMLIIWLLMPNA